jgi:hypothetical protein
MNFIIEQGRLLKFILMKSEIDRGLLNKIIKQDLLMTIEDYLNIK